MDCSIDTRGEPTPDSDDTALEGKGGRRPAAASGCDERSCLTAESRSAS